MNAPCRCGRRVAVERTSDGTLVLGPHYVPGTQAWCERSYYPLAPRRNRRRGWREAWHLRFLELRR